MEIWECLEPSIGGAYLCGAYTILKHCYQHASAQALNPSFMHIEKVRGDLQTLYHREEPHTPSLPLATHVYPEKVNYEIPSEAELQAAVRCLCPHRAGRHIHLCMEHFKQCQ